MVIYSRLCMQCGQHQARVRRAIFCNKRVTKTRPTKVGAVITWVPCRGVLVFT